MYRGYSYCSGLYSWELSTLYFEGSLSIEIIFFVASKTTWKGLPGGCTASAYVPPSHDTEFFLFCRKAGRLVSGLALCHTRRDCGSMTDPASTHMGVATRPPCVRVPMFIGSDSKQYRLLFLLHWVGSTLRVGVHTHLLCQCAVWTGPQANNNRATVTD